MEIVTPGNTAPTWAIPPLYCKSASSCDRLANEGSFSCFLSDLSTCPKPCHILMSLRQFTALCRLSGFFMVQLFCLTYPCVLAVISVVQGGYGGGGGDRGYSGGGGGGGYNQGGGGGGERGSQVRVARVHVDEHHSSSFVVPNQSGFGVWIWELVIGVLRKKVLHLSLVRTLDYYSDLDTRRSCFSVSGLRLRWTAGLRLWLQPAKWIQRVRWSGSGLRRRWLRSDRRLQSNSAGCHPLSAVLSDGLDQLLTTGRGGDAAGLRGANRIQPRRLQPAAGGGGV